MWLINTDTLELKEFRESNRPRYAILSHTWGSGNDDEVSFREMSVPTASRHVRTLSRLGYHKISKTCEIAKGDGLDWAWVDTCCIQKESSAELTESINSMFKWYQDSCECYVYLEDFCSSSPLAAASADAQDKLLAKCRWWSRGWTLQELLAPKELHFFDSSWNRLGTKTELAELIARIIPIPADVLVDARRSILNSYSVAAKFSWSGCRTTSRIEDRAYSLLGIFDVHMPMIYGEGERAFRRLQEEIIKLTNDLTIFAWRGPDTSVQRIPGKPETWLAEGFSALAPSPDTFSGMGDLRPFRHSFPDFSVTNKGILLSKDVPIRKLTLWDGDIDIYALMVGVYEREGRAKGGADGICLRKTGPHLFQRCSTVSELGTDFSMHVRDRLSDEDLRIIDDTEGNYLMLHTGSAELRQLRERHRHLSIQIRQNSQWRFVCAVPDSLWDTTDQVFLRPTNYRYTDNHLALMCWMENREIRSSIIVFASYNRGDKAAGPQFQLLDPAKHPKLAQAILKSTDRDPLRVDRALSKFSGPIPGNLVEHVHLGQRYQTRAVLEKACLTGFDNVEVWAIRLWTETVSGT